jgi:hypothetical protein
LNETIVFEVKVNREYVEAIKKEWKDADIQKYLEEIARIVINSLVEITQFKKTNKKLAVESFAKFLEGEGARLFRVYILGQKQWNESHAH